MANATIKVTLELSQEELKALVYILGQQCSKDYEDLKQAGLGSEIYNLLCRLS